MAQQDVDRIIEMKNKIKEAQAVYLYAPIWFVKCEYKGEIYNLWLDGVTGTVIRGDIPTAKFGIF